MKKFPKWILGKTIADDKEQYITGNNKNKKFNLSLFLLIVVLSIITYIVNPGSRIATYSFAFPLIYILMFCSRVALSKARTFLKNNIFTEKKNIVEDLFSLISDYFLIFIFMFSMISLPLSIIKYIFRFGSLELSERIVQLIYATLPPLNIFYALDIWINGIRIALHVFHNGF